MNRRKAVRLAVRSGQPRGFAGRRNPVPRGERGFTLVELMIAIVLIGIGTAFITNTYVNSYRLWKTSFDTLILQRDVRLSMAMMTQALREGKPGTVVIRSPGGFQFSEIEFLDGRDRGWIFRQTGKKIQMVMPPSPGGTASSTRYSAGDIEYLVFSYPSFVNTALIEIGISARKVSYAGEAKPIVVQLVERVMLRNP